MAKNYRNFIKFGLTHQARNYTYTVKIKFRNVKVN